MPRDKWISFVEWSVIIGVGVVDIILSRTTGISISVPVNNAETLAIIVALWPLTALLTRLTGFAKGSESLAESVAKFFVYIMVVTALEYYLATNQAPLNDPLMVKIDRLFGFSWPEFFAWVHDHRPVGKVLSYMYASLPVQAALVLFVVGVVYPRRADRFVTAFLVSSLLTLLIFGLFPVAGPFIYFQHTDLSQARYAEHYLQMRSHAMAAIPMDDIRGIISFPSFHVASAVIITYFFRRLSFISGLVVVLNIGMSIGALVIGGHYLVDVLAGLVVGLATIAVLRWLQGTQPEQRLALGLRRFSPMQARAGKRRALQG
jgi:membrane-associated phospholipid phosphatase